eukprot:1158644-Pelagomonas_calceolata.AAC.5
MSNWWSVDGQEGLLSSGSGDSNSRPGWEPVVSVLLSFRAASLAFWRSLALGLKEEFHATLVPISSLTQFPLNIPSPVPGRRHYRLLEAIACFTLGPTLLATKFLSNAVEH